MATEDRVRTDDGSAIPPAARAEAFDAHEVLPHAAACGPGRRLESLDELRRRIDGFVRARDGDRAEEGRLQDLHRWLEGLRRQALIVRGQGPPLGE